MRALLIVLGLIVCGVAGYLLWQPTAVELIDFETPPRDPVVADPGATPIGLSVIDDPFSDVGNALRRTRNELAVRMRDALAAYRAGEGSLRDVERIEIRFWVARRQLAEIDDATYHAHMAALFDRERERLELLGRLDPPLASPATIERARLYVLRERHLAGEADAGYAKARKAFLASAKERMEYLRTQGSREYDGLKDEYDDWLNEFPQP